MDNWTKIVSGAIGLFFPRAALQYAMSRTILKKGYMGGSLRGPDRMWNPGNDSPDKINQVSRDILRARARDLLRNSPYMGGAIQKIVNNVVYTGIKPQFKHKNADKLEEMFNKWAFKVGFYEKQQLALSQMFVDGEVLGVHTASRHLREKGLCPMNFRLYEADYLDESHDNEEAVQGGIQYDAEGWPEKYRLYKTHPGESINVESDWLPAKNVVHLYREKRAGQRRGVSEIATIIMEMRDFTEYQNNERIAARLASAFGVMLESPYPEHQQTNPITGEGAGTGTTVPNYIEAGRIDVLPMGLKPHIVENKRPGHNYEPYTRVSLRGVSAGLGLSYETFSNDYSMATYSSARSAALEERRGYRVLQDLLVHAFCMPAIDAWWGYAGLVGLVEGDMPEVGWQAPGWPWVDPMKDARAAAVKMGLKITSRRRLAAEAGDDIDEIDKEIEDDKVDYASCTGHA